MTIYYLNLNDEIETIKDVVSFEYDDYGDYYIVMFKDGTGRELSPSCVIRADDSTVSTDEEMTEEEKKEWLTLIDEWRERYEKYRNEI